LLASRHCLPPDRPASAFLRVASDGPCSREKREYPLAKGLRAPMQIARDLSFRVKRKCAAPHLVRNVNLSDFQAAREYAMRGVQIWRSGAAAFPVEDVETAAACCL